MSPRRLLLIAVMCLAWRSSAATAAAPLQLFVSPQGNDGWTGLLPAPRADGRDGPFATLDRARDEVRNRKSPAGAVVSLRGGTYFLGDRFALSPEDSGSPQAPVVYEAYHGEKPIISGGLRLEGWKQIEGGRWQTTIRVELWNGWTFNQLFVNGQRRYRPRWPREGYAHIAASLPPTAAHARKGYDRFRFAPGDVRADWKNRDDVEVLTFQQWTMCRLRIADVEEASHVVTFAGSTHSLEGYAALTAGWRYVVENVAEELKDPGQWYLDNATGVVTYLPAAGEAMETAEVIAPHWTNLVRITGDWKKGQWVRNVTFRGISFQHCNWALPRGGHSVEQAEVSVAGAIIAEGARDCAFEHCSVSHVGTYAIELGAGCRDNRIEDCDLTDLGAGGVKIGTTSLYGPDEDLAQGNVVRNCTIAGGGRLHPAGVGVWVGQSHHNTIEHNDIVDFYYTGVSLGWTWGYARSGAHHNRVIDNHIAHIGQGVLSDMGGIYTLGICPGTQLKSNLIHDVESATYGGWGIYPDEGTSQLRAENNVVYRTKTGGFHQHYGKENTIVNNIFAFGREQELQRTRPETHLSFTFERNVVYWKSPAKLFDGRWDQGPGVTALDHNVYWNGGKTPLLFGKLTFEQWQKTGQDAHSAVADPLFENADLSEAAAWRLRANSPALAAGFVPFDITRAGRLDARPIPSLPPAFPVTNVP